LPADPVITTDRRTYHVRLVSTRSTAISSIRWTYPQDELLALKLRTEAVQAAAPVAAGVERLHFNYAISGDRQGGGRYARSTMASASTSSFRRRLARVMRHRCSSARTARPS
jgi:hypothetical protein